jgi:uncharacterized protein YyaL (SSP411 family)
MPNRLAQAASPYLLQHAENPVDWYPWGEEALGKARAEGKPIFLSIGYSACHWCHVMEHESFENAEVAAFLNEHFVSIKVDREERPDLDHIYMTAVQMIQRGGGGWPLSAFLTPQGEPFYGGTYWPTPGRMGMPSFMQILEGVHEAWTDRHAEVMTSASRVTEALASHAAGAVASGEGKPTADALTKAAETLRRQFDDRYGGFGTHPKFPHPMDLRLLLRLWAESRESDLLEMAEFTIRKMAAGGIYDQLGGGFHRYSVDAKWLVPHFEKMLYDNAQMATVFVEAYQITGYRDYERVARETIDWVLREMTNSEGGFQSTLDADTEGEEGLTYVWTPEEIATVIGPEAALTFCAVYDVSRTGNFEGRNILNRPKSSSQMAVILNREPDELEAELATSRVKLLAARVQRPQPGQDDKVITSWNALMIEALALAGGAFREPRYISAAIKSAEFLLTTLTDDEGRLLHSWRNGQASGRAFLDDYSYLANALVTLYEATFDPRWIQEAVKLTETMLARFADTSGGGFFYTADDGEQLVVRHKETQDSSVPSGTSVAATVLVRLARFTGRADFHSAAERTLAAHADFLTDFPTGATQMLLALADRLGPYRECVLLASQSDPASGQLLDALRQVFIPHRLLVKTEPGQQPPGGSEHLADLCAGAAGLDQSPALLVCENFACQQPVFGSEAILRKLEELAVRKG